MTNRGYLFGAAWLILGANSCSGKSEPDPPAKGISYLQFCTEVCAVEKSCATPTAASCQASCENNLAPEGPKTRGEYYLNYSNCVKNRGCEGLKRPDVCVGVASEILVPTQAAMDACGLFDKKLEDCAFIPLPGFCLINGGGFTDATNQEVAACTDKPCELLDACVKAAWGVPL